MRIRALIAVMACLSLAGLVGAGEATASRARLVHEGLAGEEWIYPNELSHLPEEEIEGACGLAVRGATHDLYLSDYYHRAVERFSDAGNYLSIVAKSSTPGHNSVCGLAVDEAGNLYGNEFHQRVMRLPGEETIDPGPSTGVAVDAAGDLYVDDRTYVAVYDAPVEPGDEPSMKIGLNHLQDAYGVAVDSSSGRVYVAEAAEDEVAVFEPAVDPEVPQEFISGSPSTHFQSLVNASLAVDESSTEGKGHLLVVDDLKPLFSRPEAAIFEFNEKGEFLDVLARRILVWRGLKNVAPEGPIFGEPSGIAVDSVSGDLYVTTGNSEESNVLAYGPYEKVSAMSESSAEPAASPALPSAALASAVRPPGEASTTAPAARKGGGGPEAVTVRHGPVQVRFDGELTPHSLPRRGVAPVGIAVDVQISATNSDDPPQLRRIAIAINRNGRLGTAGLPVCRLDQIQPSTSAGAKAACGNALVGEGHFSANVKLPQQSPFPSEGKVLAFNGKVNGHPAILAHIFGSQPVPTSVVLPFTIGTTHGTYGTILRASLPQATGNWGYVTGLKMNLRRRFSYHGKARSYLSAGCPALPGFRSAVFPLTRTSFSFADGPTLSPVLTRTCRAKG